jgi:hypothetical protein
MYQEYHGVYPLGKIGTPPPPLPHSECVTPLNQRGGHARLRVRGWGSPNSDDGRKNQTLCLLRVRNHIGIICLAM